MQTPNQTNANYLLLSHFLLVSWEEKFVGADLALGETEDQLSEDIIEMINSHSDQIYFI